MRGFNSSLIDNINKLQNSAYTVTYTKSDQRIFNDILTVYELAAILGIRTEHLSNNAKPLIALTVDNSSVKGMDPFLIAVEELRDGKLPFYIKRYGDKSCEIYSVNELMLNLDDLYLSLSIDNKTDREIWGDS